MAETTLLLWLHYSCFQRRNLKCARSWSIKIELLWDQWWLRLGFNLKLLSCFPAPSFDKIKIHIRHSMLLKTRKRHWNWKKREMMLSREKNMKLPRNSILKELKWSMASLAMTRDHSGQTERFVKTFWGNMKKLWHTLRSLSKSIQNAPRQAFNVNASEIHNSTMQ